MEQDRDIKNVVKHYAMPEIFSIGYGNRPIEDTFRLLELYGCGYVIDVRSSPFSRFQPRYNRDVFQVACRAVGIRYVFMGDLLGGRPKTDRCYDTQGRVDYECLASETYFRAGITRLETAISKHLRISLLCSELRPEDCHRSKLIGQALLTLGIRVRHIDADGIAVDQDAVVRRITCGQEDLFGGPSQLIRSRRQYKSAEAHD